MMQIAQNSFRPAYAALPTAAVLIAGITWDQDLLLVVPVLAICSLAAGLFSYFRDPDGRWWMAAVWGGITGLLLGVAALFYIASRI